MGAHSLLIKHQLPLDSLLQKGFEFPAKSHTGQIRSIGGPNGAGRKDLAPSLSKGKTKRSRNQIPHQIHHDSSDHPQMLLVLGLTHSSKLHPTPPSSQPQWGCVLCRRLRGHQVLLRALDEVEAQARGHREVLLTMRVRIAGPGGLHRRLAGTAHLSQKGES